MAIKLLAGPNESLKFTNPVLPPALESWAPVYGPPTGETSVFEVIDDRRIETVSGDYDPAEGIALQFTAPSPVLESLTPEVGVVNEAGNGFDLLTAGAFMARVRASGYKTSSIFYDPVDPPASQDRVDSFTVGSLARNSNDEVQAYMVADEQSPPTRLYSTYNSSTNDYVRNTSLWANAYDFTGCVTNVKHPPSKNFKGKLGGALISPSVVDFSKHYGSVRDGSQVYFVDDLNVTHIRDVVGFLDFEYFDIRLILLDTPLPPSIAPYDILPDLTPWIGSGGWSNPKGGPACIYVDGNDAEDAFFCGMMAGSVRSKDRTEYVDGTPYTAYSGSVYHLDGNYTISYQPPVVSMPYEGYSKTAFSGDSGSPNFLVEEGRLVFFFRNEGPASGTSTEGLKSFYDAAIAELWAQADTAGYPGFTGAPETVTEATLSGIHTVYNP